MIAAKIEANFAGQNRLHPDKFFNKRVWQDAERHALNESKNKALELYRKITETWTNRPQFSARRTRSGWSIIVSDKRFFWLDQGTKVRYATMTPDYKPKTKVGVMYSYKGAGRVAYVNKGIKRPGIKARGWSEKVHAEVEKIIHKIYRERLHSNWINK